MATIVGTSSERTSLTRLDGSDALEGEELAEALARMDGVRNVKFQEKRAFIGSYENVKAFLQALTPEHRSLIRNLYVYIKAGPTPSNLRLQMKFKPQHRGSISQTTMEFGLPIPFKHDKVKFSPGVLCFGGREQIGFKADDWKEAEKERLKVHKELEAMVEKDRCVVRVLTYEQQMCAYIVGTEAVCRGGQ